jgi:hypothetical protein
MDTIEEGQQTSSMVDDTFFIVKKSVRYAHEVIINIIMYLCLWNVFANLLSVSWSCM